MATKHIGFIGLLLLCSAMLHSCGCKEDSYGEELGLILPFEVTPAQDTFSQGDTLWIEANIDKHVRVLDQDATIYLEGFNFFTKLVISEISDTLERYIPNPNVLVSVGELEVLPLQTAIAYPILYEETADAYRFKAGLILEVAGLFHLGFSTRGSTLERYEHPALYTCNNNRRDQVQIYYQNSATDRERYERLFLQTKVPYLLDLIDFQRYSDFGGYTFVVSE